MALKLEFNNVRTVPFDTTYRFPWQYLLFEVAPEMNSLFRCMTVHELFVTNDKYSYKNK